MWLIPPDRTKTGPLDAEEREWLRDAAECLLMHPPYDPRHDYWLYRYWHSLTATRFLAILDQLEELLDTQSADRASGEGEEGDERAVACG